MLIPSSWVVVGADGVKRLRADIKVEVLPDIMSDEMKGLMNLEVVKYEPDGTSEED